MAQERGPATPANLRLLRRLVETEDGGEGGGDLGQALGGAGAGPGHVGPGGHGLDHLDVALELGLGAAGADHDPRPGEGEADHVGRGQAPVGGARGQVADAGDGAVVVYVPHTTAGVTINGLCVLHEEPDLVDAFTRSVTGGPDGFALPCPDYARFAEAMRRKLTREIA